MTFVLMGDGAQTWHLIFLQGFMVGLTGGTIFAPIVVWVSFL